MEYHLPIVEIDGKKYGTCIREDFRSNCLRRYYHLVIEIEPYYGLSPVWLRVIQRPLENAAKKRLLNETVIYEMYKKYFGRRKATTYKVSFSLIFEVSH